MNEFRFICARLIFYERVLKILSVTERHSHLHFTVPPEVLSIYLNRQLVNNDVVFTDFEYIMNFPISTSATPTSMIYRISDEKKSILQLGTYSTSEKEKFRFHLKI